MLGWCPSLYAKQPHLAFGHPKEFSITMEADDKHYQWNCSSSVCPSFAYSFWIKAIKGYAGWPNIRSGTSGSSKTMTFGQDDIIPFFNFLFI